MKKYVLWCLVAILVLSTASAFTVTDVIGARVPRDRGSDTFNMVFWCTTVSCLVAWGFLNVLWTIAKDVALRCKKPS